MLTQTQAQPNPQLDPSVLLDLSGPSFADVIGPILTQAPPGPEPPGSPPPAIKPGEEEAAVTPIATPQKLDSPRQTEKKSNQVVQAPLIGTVPFSLSVNSATTPNQPNQTRRGEVEGPAQSASVGMARVNALSSTSLGALSTATTSKAQDGTEKQPAVKDAKPFELPTDRETPIVSVQSQRQLPLQNQTTANAVDPAATTSQSSAQTQPVQKASSETQTQPNQVSKDQTVDQSAPAQALQAQTTPTGTQTQPNQVSQDPTAKQSTPAPAPQAQTAPTGTQAQPNQVGQDPTLNQTGPAQTVPAQPVQAAAATKVAVESKSNSGTSGSSNVEPISKPASNSNQGTSTDSHSQGNPNPSFAQPAPHVQAAGASQKTAAPAELSALTGASRAAVVRQVADKLQMMVAARSQATTTIQLAPKALGTITLSIKNLNGEIDTQISASNDHVRTALEHSRPDLAGAIQSKGYQVGNISVSGGSSKSSSGNSAQNQPQKQQPNPQRFLQSNDPPAPDPAAPTYSTAKAVDVWI